jgi:hypothetical protein
MIEVLKQALEALEECRRDPRLKYEHPTFDKAITSLRQAIAELKSQEPDYWLGYGLQAHTEKPFENATALYAHPPQRTEERNFCSRCGKRTNDIHTCTPPQCTEQDLSEQGRKKSAILGNNIEEMVNNGLPFLTALDTALKVYDHHTPRLHPPQRTEQEPVAWRYALDASVEGPRWIYIDKDPHQWLLGPAMAMAVIEKLYTHPPQRTWVGLTLDEIARYLKGTLSEALMPEPLKPNSRIRTHDKRI